MKKSRKISFRLVSIWTICDKWSRQDPSHKKCTRVWSGSGHGYCYWQRLGLATLAPTSVRWLRHPRVTARWGFRLILSGCQEIVRAWLIKWSHLTVQLRHFLKYLLLTSFYSMNVSCLLSALLWIQKLSR